VTTYVQVIPEEKKRGKRLGRHVRHDERSRAFGADVATEVSTKRWRRYGKPFDQGDLGACTGFAAATVLQMLPAWVRGRRITAETARAIYSGGTKNDPFDGEWPDQDTGSSGLGVAKALVQMGFITGYTHAFGLDHLNRALMVAPGIWGINWYDSFDKPDRNGVVRITPNAGVRGGHETAIAGQIIKPSQGESLLECWQSWGPGFGKKGRFYVPMPDVERLLSEDGDVTFFKLS
jgi:hypothetical protein